MAPVRGIDTITAGNDVMSGERLDHAHNFKAT
jgi:hypothetical protein